MKKIIFALCLTVFINSCSSDETPKEESFLYKSEKINFTEIVNNQLGYKLKSTDSNSDDYFHSEFESSLYVPSNLSSSELEKYFSENQNLISGTLKYLINDDEFITIEIVNGQEISHSSSNRNIQFRATSYPCSYDGIQKCVQDAIDKWHVLTKVICAFGAYSCVGEEVAICIYDNC